MRVFLEQLLKTGRVTVPPMSVPYNGDEDYEELILEFDRAARAGMAYTAPDLDVEVADWAARLLAETSRLVIARDAGPDVIAAAFSIPCPMPHSAQTDYSADLFLRYLPALAAIIQRLSAEDPLLEKVRAFAVDWPLSAVGMNVTAAAEEHFNTLFRDRSLLMLYVDRVMAAGSIEALALPAVATAVRSVLGGHPELAPEFSKALDKGTAQTVASGVEAIDL